jgi:Spy/CpxP family protein refolding chaperone
MKQRILAGALLLAATISGGSGAWAAGEERPGPGMAGGPGRGPCAKMPPGDHVDQMAKVLGLSETQQKQIKDILKTEHDKNAALMEKMAEYRKQLQAAEQATTFDETAVWAIAVEQARTGIELTVSRARVQSRINAVLTAEQRTLRQKLHPHPEPGPGHPPRFPCERG